MKKPNSVAGGSAWPDSKIGPDGKFARKDLHSQTSHRKKNANSPINSIFGRSEDAGETESQAGISIFDPTLCELVYRWFSPEGAIVLDPFAGGSVRGIVASKLKRNYVGSELRKEQVEANIKQGNKICTENIPQWICGDSLEIEKNCKNIRADLIFSCPPYADLEVYSEDPKDISNMPYDQFLKIYKQIVAASCRMLNDDRFACFVVGDLRDKKGLYRNFVSHTIEAFVEAGLSLYNEAILVTAVGSLPIRSGRTFSATRKLGKTHQNVLVFVKGDPKKAAAYCGEVDVDFAADLNMGEEQPYGIEL